MNSYPLSNAQKRIWYSQKKHQGSPLFNIGGTIHIKGHIEVEIMKRAISKVIHDNIALKLQFFEKENQVFQSICNEIDDIDYIDFSKEDAPLESYNHWSDRKIKTAFEMENKSLYYFAVLKITDSRMGFFIKIHHIIADGWSIKLLTDQLVKNYEQLINGLENKGEKYTAYIEYALEEDNNIIAGMPLPDKMEKAKEYWTGMFDPFPEINVTTSNCLDGKRKSFTLSDEIRLKIEDYIKGKNKSLNIFFVCVYLLYEYKKSGREDIVIGTPLLGRFGKKERQIFGTFTNPMPFRYIIDSNMTAEELIKQVANRLMKSYAHQKYPYNLLQQDLNLSANGLERLFDVCINYYNTTISRKIDGVEVENIEFYSSQQEYALQIIIRHWEENKLTLDFDFQTAVYTCNQIEDMFDQLNLIIGQILNNPFLKISEFNIVSEQDRKSFISDFNNTKRKYPKDKTWLDLFYDNVKKQPDHIAISHRHIKRTYKELNELSDKAAAYLMSAGVKAFDIVAIIPNHNIESIFIIIAIMKCSAVYLPIDVDTPDKRIVQIVSDSGAKLLISDKYTDEFSLKIVSPDEILSSRFSLRNTDFPNFPEPGSFAYIIYTSGSTGIPKGVAITHGNLMNYLCWAKSQYIRNEHEVFALYSSFSFDFTITSIFLPLISGGEIRIYDNKINVFDDIIKENKATIVKVTPSHIAIINDIPYKNTSIHTFIAGGEDLKVEMCRRLYRQFNQNTYIYNEYGPTEATIGCMIYLYSQDEGVSVPIGTPISNTYIYILDKNLQPVPKDTVGELYICGDGVAEGYYKLEDETKKKFIKNPYMDGKTMYKTGDMALRDHSGNIVFVGRNDNEIKIRGNRVNLSEIEARILSSGMVKNVVVKVDDINGSTQICIFVIEDETYDQELLKTYLKEHLPSYMIPQFITSLIAFPLTINGKIDIEKLKILSIEKESKGEVQLTKELGILMEAAGDIITNKKIDPGDNFYTIGGDSIKAIQISSRLNERGYELPVRDILTNPIINDMAPHMKKKSENLYDQGVLSGDIIQLPITEWFFEQNFKQEEYYGQSTLLKLKQDISDQWLKDIFLELIRHHDVLRMNYDKRKNVLFYNNLHLNSEFEIDKIDLCDISQLEVLVNKSFDLENDLLIKVYLVKSNGTNYLYLILHHLVVDGVSWRIILEDIARLLSQVNHKEVLKLPEKTSSYQNYAKEYKKWEESISNDNTYWHSTLNDKDIHNLLSDKDELTYAQSKTEYLELDEDITGNLLSRANEPYNTKADELILVALGRTIKELFGTDNMIFEVESHGRNTLEKIDVNRTVGWFTSMLPIDLQIKEQEIKEQIKSIKEQIRKANKNQIRSKQKYIRFNYLGEYTEVQNDYFSVKQLMFEHDIGPDNKMLFLMDINAITINKKLTIHVRCGTKFFIGIVDELAKNFRKQIIDVVEHCMNLEERVYTPTDFDTVDLSQKELDKLIGEV